MSRAHRTPASYATPGMRRHPLFLAYVEAALWSSTDDDGRPLDDAYSIEDIDETTLHEMMADCGSFIAKCNSKGIPLDEYDKQRAGHDFWLTRNDYGAGFWDGDWEEPIAGALTKIAESFGPYDLQVDDGVISGG